jgi:hypothetical protein
MAQPPTKKAKPNAAIRHFIYANLCFGTEYANTVNKPLRWKGVCGPGLGAKQVAVRV